MPHSIASLNEWDRFEIRKKPYIAILTLFNNMKGMANECGINCIFSIELSLYTILQILSVSLFEKIPILQAFTFTDYNKLNVENPNQLNLFD